MSPSQFPKCAGMPLGRLVTKGSSYVRTIEQQTHPSVSHVLIYVSTAHSPLFDSHSPPIYTLHMTSSVLPLVLISDPMIFGLTLFDRIDAFLRAFDASIRAQSGCDLSDSYTMDSNHSNDIRCLQYLTSLQSCLTIAPRPCSDRHTYQSSDTSRPFLALQAARYPSDSGATEHSLDSMTPRPGTC